MVCANLTLNFDFPLFKGIQASPNRPEAGEARDQRRAKPDKAGVARG